jgi:hypothetical protein
LKSNSIEEKSEQIDVERIKNLLMIMVLRKKDSEKTDPKRHLSIPLCLGSR